MEILQDFESVKWRRLLVWYICMLVICLAAIIFVIVYDKASLWGGSAAIALIITIPISFVSSSKCIAFECIHSAGCWCAKIRLSDEAKAKLKLQFNDCLCESCLKEIASGK